MMTIFTNPPHFQDILRMTWCSFQPQLGAGVNAPLGRQPKAFHWANQQFQPPRRGGTNHSAKKLLKSKTACFINRNENSPWLLTTSSQPPEGGKGVGQPQNDIVPHHFRAYLQPNQATFKSVCFESFCRTTKKISLRTNVWVAQNENDKEWPAG